MPPDEAWQRLARAVIDRPIELAHHHSLARPRPALKRLAGERVGASIRRRVSGGFQAIFTRAEPVPCPLYPNYGFIAATPALMHQLADVLFELHEPVERLVGNDFYGQVAIALAIEAAELPRRALPITFNFPNDRRADRQYADQLDDIAVLHYLRTKKFDRQRIFADEDEFNRFLELQLVGSDLVLQRHVHELTGGRYPFP
jgi:hypothetical protein